MCIVQYTITKASLSIAKPACADKEQSSVDMYALYFLRISLSL
jgi:hypothetical protein